MGYKTKERIPKRDDRKYKEIEDFKDFELINNTFYEMGIRTRKFKELEKKYAYSESLSNEINKHIKWVDPLENIQSQDFTSTNTNKVETFVILNKSAEENFEDALKKYEKDSPNIYSNKLYKLLELDFEKFKEETQIISFESKKNEELKDCYHQMESFLCLIPEIIQKDLYIDFFDYYYENENTSSKTYVEYAESSATSLYIKREFKETYYIETVIDDDNQKISRTLYPLTKRKLVTDHTLKFLSNHLILHKQVIKFLEKILKVIEVKIKKQIALADAFFCFDYYNFRLEEVVQHNKELTKYNLGNILLQDAKDSIKEINHNTDLTDQQKAKERLPYCKVIQCEELKLLETPALNKKSKYYIFNENKFKKSSINGNTALKYYQWIKPYIDNNEYINIINSEQLF